MSRALLPGLLVLISACGPSPKPPVRVMALVPDQAGAFQTTEVQLTTVDNVTTLKGSVVEFVGAASVVLDPNDPLQGNILNMNDDQRYEVLVKDKGVDVRGHYIDRGGVLWPADFHTWQMVSTYYNFEKAYAYWNELYDGVDPKELRPMKVLYWSDVRLNSTTSLTDNALYLSFIKAFTIVPFKNEQLIPLPMNIGVIGHEVAHRVFNFKVLEDKGFPSAITANNWNQKPFNLLKSLDEGLADFHGFGVTCPEAAGCRSNYLAISLSDERTVRNRDLARTDACMDEATRTAFTNFDKGQWVTAQEMYRVGNLIAASLYQSANKAGKLDVMQRAVLLAYDDESNDTPGLRQLVNRNLNTPQFFTVEAVGNAFASHISDPELLRRFCVEYSSRLQTTCAGRPCPEMPGCNDVAWARDTSICPLLPPSP
jgi:hypothetical protein